MPRFPLSDSIRISIDDGDFDMRVLESHYGCCWAACEVSAVAGADDLQRSSVPTYPAPTQQMFFTPPLFCRAAFSDLLLVLCLPEAVSSNASCSFNACSTGLKDKLPSGVVGAVEISTMLSSESTAEAGKERCRNMLVYRVGARMDFGWNNSSLSIEGAL